MNRAEFEADFQQQGYELREGKIKPKEHRTKSIPRQTASAIWLDVDQLRT